LLKVLLALGGRDVKADQLADALWPHIEADYAHKSFHQTLHRLRTFILENDEAMILRDGRLKLNHELIWVDTWALEHLIAEIDAELRESGSGIDHALLQGLIDELLLAYRGPFLPDDDEQPGYIACREQIRARLLRVMNRVARHWEDVGRRNLAIDAYLRCIDADELWEPLYRELMLCMQRGGSTEEAVATYEQLRAVLAARQKRMPSAQTQAVYVGLQRTL
jgi:two-component SAPR family response regulator